MARAHAVARVDALREARGASPLRQNALVERVAHEYAERVCDTGRVAHVLEDGESPVDRLRAHGLGARVVGEAVARGATSEAAFQSLVASPAHYAALIDRRFTDVGTADAVASDGRACVVVLLASWPRRLATASR